jgi:hypothetical protein
MFVIPKISEQEARNIFSNKKKFSSFKFKKISLSPERAEIIYLPFYLFDIVVKKEAKEKNETYSLEQKVTLSVDGLLGHSVFYAVDDLAVENNREPKVCDFSLSLSEAERIAMSEYKTLLLEHGLRTHSFSETEKISVGRKIFYPFWIGYFKKRKGYDFIALDAVSGEIQGIKMRKVFMRAFRQMA